MTYEELVARLEVLAVTRVSESDAFATILPGAIQAGELRCLRDCDFPSARRVRTATLTPGLGSIAPPGDMVVARQFWLLAPVGSQNRAEIQRRDASYLREFWPNLDQRATPRYFDIQDSGTILLVPVPDAAYQIEMAYTYRPPGISAENPTTWLSLRYPDLLVYATMVFVAGYQRNFGAQADDPQMPGSWEREYQKALAVARNESRTGKGWGAFDATPAPPPSSLAPTG